MNKRNSGAPTSFSRIWKEYYVWCNILLMLVAIPVVIWILLFIIDLWTHHGETSTVPDVRGMMYDQAVERLDEENLDVVISDSIDNPGNLVGGTIVEIVPKPGSVVKKGREVYLTIVAYNPHQVQITEPLANRDLKSVMNYLYNLGIDTSKINVKRVPWMYPGSVVAVHTGNRTIDMGCRVAVNARITIEYGVEDDELLSGQSNYIVIDSLINAEPEPDTIDPDASAEEPAGQPKQPVDPTPANPSNPLYD